MLLSSRKHTAEGKETGETAHVERWNYTLRQRLNASRQALRGNDTMGKSVWKIEEKERTYDSPNHLTPIGYSTLAELRRRYEETLNVESRTRYQMLLLA